MTLQESEIKLSELNSKIDNLLKEREAVLKEWNKAFNTENPDGVFCEVENIENVCYEFYLVNSDSKMHLFTLGDYEMKSSIEDFYKHIDTSICISNIAKGRGDMPDYQKNLVYAKAIEVRDDHNHLKSEIE